MGLTPLKLPPVSTIGQYPCPSPAPGPSSPGQTPTWEFVGVLLHVFQHEGVSVGDDEPVGEDLDVCSDTEVIRSIEGRSVWWAAWLGHPRPLQELATNSSRVANGWFMDRNHVVRESVRDDEFTTIILWFGGVLKRGSL